MKNKPLLSANTANTANTAHSMLKVQVQKNTLKEIKDSAKDLAHATNLMSKSSDRLNLATNYLQQDITSSIHQNDDE